MAAKVVTEGGKTWKTAADGITPTHIFNKTTGKWDPIKHPRGVHGHFAHVPGSGAGGKAAPASFKFYKPGFVPKQFSQLPAAAKAKGAMLYAHKQSGALKNDYEYHLHAQKLAAAHNKLHPDNKLSHNQIINAGFRHELNDKGSISFNPAPVQGQAPKASAPEVPTPAAKPVHHATKSGVKLVSKFAKPGDLHFTGKTMGGVSGAQVWEDTKGQKWLVKFPGGSKGTSKAYSNSKFLTDLDVATSRIQNKAGLPVPSVTIKELNGKYASVHKMYSRVTDAFPNNDPQLGKLSDKEIQEIQQNMVVDWLLSNHDPHSGNFLKTDKGIIGIDKGQSFKYFAKDKLTVNFGQDINPPLAPNKPVYSTLMKQYVNGDGELQPFNEGELHTTIQRIQDIPDNEYKDLLRPYAVQAMQQGLLGYPGKSPSDLQHIQVEKFLAAAVARKNNLQKDFDGLWDTLQKEIKVHDQGDDFEVVHDFTKGTPTHGFKVGDPIQAVYPSGGIRTGTVTATKTTDGPGLKYEADGGTYTLHLGDDGSWESNAGLKVTVSKPGAKPLSATKSVPKLKVGRAKPAFGGGSSAMSLANADQWKPETALKMFEKGAITFDELKEYVSENADMSLDDLMEWKSHFSDSPDWFDQLTQAFNLSVGLPSDSIDVNLSKLAKDKLAPNYKLEKNTDGTWSIQKPSGGFSSNKSGDKKTWPTQEDALNSSTMAKYKASPEPKFTPGEPYLPPISLAGIDFSKPDDYPGVTKQDMLDLKAMSDQNSQEPLKGDHYLAYKKLAQKIKNAKKAAGAAEIVNELDVTPWYVPGPDVTPSKPKDIKLPTPKWKAKGGAPPPLSKATGPYVQELGAQLYDMKKQGKFDTDDDLWKAATRLSNQDKKRALKINPDAKSGADYSSPNQIRNVSQRLEFDEVGDVIWETKQEKTSQVEGQTLAEIKKTIKVHEHVPVVKNAAHKPSTPSSLESSIFSDKSKPAGSYENPHAFHDSKALRAYGDKYIDNAGWNPQQKSAWYKFTGSYSGNINTYFRVGESGFSLGSNLSEAKGYAQNMLAAYKSKNVKPTEDWTVVARNTDGGWEVGKGTDHADYDDIKAMEGKIVRNKCPVSSSLNVGSTAFGGRPVRIYYKLPPGFRAIWALGHSAHSSENEVILPPGMAYKISKVEKQGNGRIDILAEVVDLKLPESI